jgi:glycosyltransferase involved in cell wall biosynthesis
MAHIALISEHASPLAAAGSVDSGGQNIYVAQIARQFAAAGHQVDIYTRKDAVDQAACVHWLPGVRVIHIEAGPARFLPKESLLPWLPDFESGLIQHFISQADPYDVVHANFFMSASVGLKAARIVGCPLIVTFHALGKVRRQHQGEADGFPDARFAMEAAVVREADCIIAECPQDRNDLVALYGADASRIAVVPCGYDPQEMQPCDMAAARAHLGWRDGRFRILQLGRLVPRKGVDNVIRAVACLRRRHKVDARLCVVGGDARDLSVSRLPEVARLRAVCAEEGVTDVVEFAGRRDRFELARYYGASDVFVTTPWYEPFGITPVEAMACERPVVGADTGGIRTTVVDGRTGFLVPPRDAETLAERLAALARNPALRAQMGNAGLRRARRLYTWKRVATELLDVYGELSGIRGSHPHLDVRVRASGSATAVAA